MTALRNLLAAIFGLYATLLFSQKTRSPNASFAPDTAVQRLFEPPRNLKWIKYFSGRLDDVSDVDISLGFDGKNCRGFLTYTESRTRLRLEGVLSGQDLRLREIGPGDETSGFFRGKYADKRFDADWSNYNNSIGARLETEEVNVSQIGMSHCGDNKWVNRYVASFGGKRFEIGLCRANNGQLYGTAWTEYDNASYVLKGNIEDNGDFRLNLKKSDGTSAGDMRGTMKFLQNLDVAWQMAGGGKQIFNFNLKETLSVGCYESADFSSAYDVIFPKTKCLACNTWFERQVSSWILACKNGIEARRQDPAPNNRATLRANGWTDVTLWTDALFCGQLTFSESWSEFPGGVAFNFDLKNGREIVLNDLFIKNFDAKSWLDAYLKKESAKVACESAECRAWLDKTGFPLQLIRREGLAFCTPFHPVFGQLEVLIPYSVLKPYLKKESLVAEFVR